MGRYYNGDIEGKFWFGLQSSYDAKHFGGNCYEPSYINFEFYKKDINDIKKGIKKCNDILGDYKSKIKEFFKKNEGWNDEMMCKHLKVNKPKMKLLMENYARLGLGLQIKKCVEKHGECCFEAEL